jgi:hypothetical protein
MMSNRTIVSRAIGAIILGTGIWCLYLTVTSASFALSTGGINGMPFDMRITDVVSSGVTMIFSCLFLLSGVSSILRSKDMQINYYPTLLKLATLIILILLSVLARSEYEATTKISFEESRGLPFAFLTFTEIRGVCNAGIVFWKCRFFDNLNILALIIDVLIIYTVVCVGVRALFESSIMNIINGSSKPAARFRVNGG